MYLLVLLFAFIILVITFFQLSNEAKLRKKKHLSKFRHAQLYVISYKSGKEFTEDAFPLIRAENVIGRKDALSNADIKISTNDLTLSRNAARLVFYDDSFVLLRLKGQKRIWIKTKDGKVYLLCPPASPLKDGETVGFGAASYETVENGAFKLESGDTLLMGNTFFKYVEEGSKTNG
ncbi:MAG: FHA domain-containing protein [Acutalibacteraceae bacterium]|nr:FHA domain-containing protein [Acutalibacteraceae bacterium]